MRGSLSAVALVAILAVNAPAEAGLILNVSSTSVSQNGTATISLTVTSDGGPTNNTLGLYNFDVSINGSGTHNAPALTFNLADTTFPPSSSNYVFANNSGGASLGYSTASGSAGFHQEVGGGDFTSDINDVTVASGQTYLLANLTVAASSTAVIGDIYHIQVYFDSGNSSFYEGLNSSTPQTNFALPMNFSSTVTIGSNAVPEPASLCLSLVAISSMMAFRRWSRRRTA